MQTLTRFTLAEEPEAFRALHRLASATLPPQRLRLLLQETETPAQALALTAPILSAHPFRFTEKQVERLAEARTAPLPPALDKHAAEMGICILLWNDPAFPPGLLNPADAPSLLFVRGALPAPAAVCVAIVGSRRATRYGLEQAGRFARGFVERGVVVVSGGAAGIDTAAHKGALDAGGQTIAVLGCGVDHSYPAENRMLFARIVEQGGAILSEYPTGTLPEPWRFPARNRIIAGMTRATLVIESPKDSGAMITARVAGEYGRDVFAVPGAVDTGRSTGCHDLIQNGAALADTPEDVLEQVGVIPLRVDGTGTTPTALPRRRDLQPKLPETSSPPEVSTTQETPSVPPVAVIRPSVPLSDAELRLLEQLSGEGRHLDTASAAAGLSAADAGVAATLLEMKGLVQRQPGNLFVRLP